MGGCGRSTCGRACAGGRHLVLRPGRVRQGGGAPAAHRGHVPAGGRVGARARPGGRPRVPWPGACAQHDGDRVWGHCPLTEGAALRPLGRAHGHARAGARAGARGRRFAGRGRGRVVLGPRRAAAAQRPGPAGRPRARAGPGRRPARGAAAAARGGRRGRAGGPVARVHHACARRRPRARGRRARGRPPPAPVVPVSVCADARNLAVHVCTFQFMDAASDLDQICPRGAANQHGARVRGDPRC